MSVRLTLGAAGALAGLAALGRRREASEGGSRNEDPYLYHATTLGNLRGPGGISRAGLRGSSRSIASHMQAADPQVFLTEPEGFTYWFTYAWDMDPQQEGQLPVALRVPRSVVRGELLPDRWGTRDADADAWRYPGSIPAEHLEVWTGEEWVPVQEHKRVRVQDAFAHMMELGEPMDSEMIPPELW
jgi:hypothetical protein